MTPDVRRFDTPGGFIIERSISLPEGELLGQDSYQYIVSDAEIAVDALHTCRATTLDGRMLMPEHAKELWAKAGWL